jgi:hypothetical protein
MLWHNTATRKRFSCAEVATDRNGIPADTTPEAERVLDEIFRRMPASRRLAIALELTESLLQETAAGVRSRHPEYTEDEVRLAVIRQSLGDELFRQVYPGVDVRP